MLFKPSFRLFFDFKFKFELFQILNFKFFFLLFWGFLQKIQPRTKNKVHQRSARLRKTRRNQIKPASCIPTESATTETTVWQAEGVREYGQEAGH